jgi:hypothetical protein
MIGAVQGKICMVIDHQHTYMFYVKYRLQVNNYKLGGAKF